MIRNKNKVFGETNDPHTVLTVPDTLTPNKYLTRLPDSSGRPSTVRTITTLDIVSNSLLILNSRGEIEPFGFSGPGRLIGTDDKRNLVTFERKVLPDNAPEGRTLILEKYGPTRPDADIITLIENLEGPYWYEIELAGCGGGGGSGAGLAQNIGLENGMDGGAGGYFKGTFSVKKDTQCFIYLGCPGGGASGYITDKTDKTIKFTQGPNGGAGGRSPNNYVYSKGGDGEKQDVTKPNALGGAGIHGGADGGTVYGWKATSSTYAGGGAGGGGNGDYGGRGGDSGPFAVSDAADDAHSKPGYLGGAGGAGGGEGIGGNGGDGYNISSQTYGNGGVGFGGGGGGGCSNGGEEELQKSGCGGGGGGCSIFTCDDFKVVCGGGGGGSGGCDISPAIASEGRNKGEDGGNNQNHKLGGGGTGGAGGTGVTINLGEVVINTSGKTGNRAWVKIWRCV